MNVVLLGEDYEKREELFRQFNEEQGMSGQSAGNPWEQVRVSSGVAVYDSEIDQSLEDLMRRADKLMYENKRNRKENGM